MAKRIFLHMKHPPHRKQGGPHDNGTSRHLVGMAKSRVATNCLPHFAPLSVELPSPLAHKALNGSAGLSHSLSAKALATADSSTPRHRRGGFLRRGINR
ncbi:MAG: hypothetical protein A3G57_03595 [Candidatus Andersenbacteria bacterium RIFCSPLOWO2_12_FULL_45_8]|nr:MAG: hypothetical protein UW94_C0012G0016 [Parcubacteria group bacterium GW2011_GWA2_45_14]OGY37671.1 MAG: hypothetical protein A3I08_00630 [Candidatus Andersenbacteria bacterium RIFCSPLOWO2_02_FULL_46_11]OGY42941.1 MAG: hypothetical protein A3G57_03595 [Candidatus Andersenbacteria bacterium RIFCSPLOWO2_12_FULL_45_8]HBE89725.1 hypothetical protein [Candidatus Andersenbacteria bacterium]